MEAATQLQAAAIDREPPPRAPARHLRTVDRLWPATSVHDTVRVFEEDPDLLDGLDASSTEMLRRRVTAPKLWADAGTWHPPRRDELPAGCIGLLVLDGLMIRSLRVAGRTCPELIGVGDVLRPWDNGMEPAIPVTVTWKALERSSVAVLDERFAAVAARWPHVLSNVLSRSLQRSRTQSFHLAIAHVRHAETRLHMLLWHLADRWGRVTPAGIHVPLALTHETLAQLVCMRRPTASTALQRLRRAGELARRSDGTWLLTGRPPAFPTEAD